MRIIFLSKSTIPSRAANSINVMKMCQSYVQLGHEVELLVPRRTDTEEVEDIWDFYGISEKFKITKLIAGISRADPTIEQIMNFVSSFLNIYSKTTVAK